MSKYIVWAACAFVGGVVGLTSRWGVTELWFWLVSMPLGMLASGGIGLIALVIQGRIDDGIR